MSEHGLASLAAMDAITGWAAAGPSGRFFQIEFYDAGEWEVTLFLEDAEGEAAGLESPFTVASGDVGNRSDSLAEAVNRALDAVRKLPGVEG